MQGNSKGEMRGFLHCASRDETMSGFGRNDAVFVDDQNRLVKEDRPTGPYIEALVNPS